MKVLGQEVYHDLSPVPAYTKKSVIDATSFSLTYDHTLDPRLDFQPSQLIRVEACSYQKNKPGVVTTTAFTFETAAATNQPDADADGIPDDMESDAARNRPEQENPFRPARKSTGPSRSTGRDFIALFPSTRAGFAEIPAFTQAGIEVCVIGDPGNPYAPMRNFDYDPALDPNHPPCDILEVLHMPESAYCVYGNYNMGHTFFFSATPAWYWDTKGYVPNNQTAARLSKIRLLYAPDLPAAARDLLHGRRLPGHRRRRRPGGHDRLRAARSATTAAMRARST